MCVLVIIDDLDFVCVTISPNKTDKPLIVDADAVLTFAFAFQRFKSIGRWNAEVVQVMSIAQHT